VSGIVDDRLLGHWLQSRRRQDTLRTRLEQSSLPLERFEGWALELIAEAVCDEGAGTRTGTRHPAREISLDDR
jgi:hypothetical protein